MHRELLLLICDTIYSLQKELQNIEDASDELMMADSDHLIPYPLLNYFRASFLMKCCMLRTH